MDQFIQVQAIDKKKINALIDEIEAEGCSCDMMIGYSCGLHKKITELRSAVNSPIKTSVN